jgi:hypothetical protein
MSTRSGRFAISEMKDLTNQSGDPDPCPVHMRGKNAGRRSGEVAGRCGRRPKTNRVVRLGGGQSGMVRRLSRELPGRAAGPAGRRLISQTVSWAGTLDCRTGTPNC